MENSSQISHKVCHNVYIMYDVYIYCTYIYLRCQMEEKVFSGNNVMADLCTVHI